jgi:hypothetical protein
MKMLASAPRAERDAPPRRRPPPRYFSMELTGFMAPSIERPETGKFRRDGEGSTRWQRGVGKCQILPPLPKHSKRTAPLGPFCFGRFVPSPTAQGLDCRTPRRLSANSGRSCQSESDPRAGTPPTGCSAIQNNCEPVAFGCAEPLQSAIPLHSELEGARQ